MSGLIQLPGEFMPGTPGRLAGPTPVTPTDPDPGGGTGGPYFTPYYWPGSYFCADYWGGGVAAALPTRNFFEALAAWLLSSSRFRTLSPGGLIHRTAPAAVVLPFVRCSDVEPNAPVSLEDTSFETTLSSYAVSDSAAKAASDALMLLLLSPAARPPLTFLYQGGAWRESAVRPVGSASPSVAYTLPDGSNVWRSDQAYEFLAVRL